MFQAGCVRGKIKGGKFRSNSKPKVLDKLKCKCLFYHKIDHFKKNFPKNINIDDNKFGGENIE